jgi:hypothetical protein
VRFAILALFILLGTFATASGRQVTVSSICSPGTVQPADVVLTICTHESGMTSFLQPKLDLRLFADGRAEYEVDPPLENRPDQTEFVMVVKQFTANPAALAAIKDLGKQPDFQNAAAQFPYYQAGMDVGIETTITFYSGGKTKSVKLVNATFGDTPEQKKQPPSLAKLHDKAILIRELATGYVRPVTFCDLIKFSDYYTDRPVSLHADLEYTTAQLYLHDRECELPAAAPALATGKIAVGYTSKTESWELKTDPIRTARFGGRARVYVSGILRDEVQPGSNVSRFRFEISEFKTVEPIVVPYQGTLEPGWTFSDTIDYTAARGLQLSSRLRVPFHHAGRVEWNNADSFPLLQQNGRLHLTFRVVSKTTELMGNNRWNDEYVCEIIELTK